VDASANLGQQGLILRNKAAGVPCQSSHKTSLCQRHPRTDREISYLVAGVIFAIITALATGERVR
jgi:hypothetical protein